ncbi:MAG: PAC2 family protein [Desulfobacteraceae bacterium]|nr:MAG: PAC2 family protein [Desulfobacteraceae bacterium]
MTEEAIQVDRMPDLRDPLLIAGFEGWGNALNVSQGMTDFLIEKLRAKPFATLNPDFFYRYDENRPIVDIQNGVLKELTPPGGTFYATENSGTERDIIVFKGLEPSLRWLLFARIMLDLCQSAGVQKVFIIGSMYDNVLHTDSIISALASSPDLLKDLRIKKVTSVNYRGPSAIHSTLLMEAGKRGLECVNLWCHCPYYLQGTVHFGLLAHLASLISSWGGFELDTQELEGTWKEIGKQIQGIIEKNPELQAMINDLRKAKMKGSFDPTRKHEKVIHLEDFLRPK